jgi:hypothetical protein
VFLVWLTGIHPTYTDDNSSPLDFYQPEDINSISGTGTLIFTGDRKKKERRKR